MSRTTFPPVRRGHEIRTSALGHESDLAASAQMVDREKHLVPREMRTLTYDVFEIAGLSPVHNVDYLIFHDRMLCHASPSWTQNALLEETECIVGAAGWYYPVGSGTRLGRHGSTGLEQKDRNDTTWQVEEFRARNKWGTGAKYLSAVWRTASRCVCRTGRCPSFIRTSY